MRRGGSERAEPQAHLSVDRGRVDQHSAVWRKACRTARVGEEQELRALGGFDRASDHGAPIGNAIPPDAEGQQESERCGSDEPGDGLAAPALPRGRDRQTGLGAGLAEPPQLVAKVGGGLPALFGVLLEALLDDVIESGRREGTQGGDGRRLLSQNRGDQRRLALAGKGLAPGRHFVKHGAERENVRAGVGLSALELLGRHVLERPQDRSFLGQRRRDGPGWKLGHVGHAPGRRRQARQSEVEQLHAGSGDYHVSRLQVAVDDARPVSAVESIGDLCAAGEDLRQRELAFAKADGERFTLDALHHEVLDTVLVADVVERADVRVSQSGNRLRLALESLPDLGVGREMGRQNLDRDVPPEPCVFRLVDFAHPACAERRQDFVWTQSRSGSQYVVLPQEGNVFGLTSRNP
jgi:hypothetical protein